MTHSRKDCGTVHSNTVNLKYSLFEMRSNLKDMIEVVRLQSKMTRAKYESLIEEGFTEEQALELCKGPIV